MNEQRMAEDKFFNGWEFFILIRMQKSDRIL